MKIKKYLITGLVVIIPVAVTVYILVGLFRFVDGILGRFLNVYLREWLGFYIPGLGLLLFFVIIFITGLLSSRFFVKKIFRRLEKWFSGLPLINKIYPPLKQIASFASSEKEFGFKKVVLVEYPSKGIWSIGFLTNERLRQIDKVTGKEMLAVFLPTTPGPLTGYVVFMPKEEVKFLDMSVNDALKIIVSGGFLKPDELKT